MDKYILKKIIAIVISGSVFIAILIAILILNKTDEIIVQPPNTKDIFPEEKKENMIANNIEINVALPSDLY